MVWVEDRNVLWVHSPNVSLYEAANIARRLGYVLFEFVGSFYVVTNDGPVKIPGRHSASGKGDNNVKTTIQLERESETGSADTEGDEETRKVSSEKEEES